MRTLLDALAPYRKAIVSGLIAAVFAAWPLLADGDLSYADIGIIAAAAASGAGITFRVPNTPKTDKAYADEHAVLGDE
ncbi:hypothetical protein HPO96_37025 [Kribbella sandramycini]|uniref:Uncharacterized protein n=1 Tax=Kribbella sandramycini TaxID=60450 RepID=A0A7Y4L7M3_9ACTN|nr:hypothetical protein [Kribbella sandramycini]MBB6564401.1 hypothetical protein [Kribbella sandramycini]NOL45863.1 hypothetical protein [Kribbella sandramycini]